MTTVPHGEVLVTVGVDTHEDVHVAVALDQLGRWLGETSIATNTGGFARLADWASEFGVADRFGVEGTGSWGAGRRGGCVQRVWSWSRWSGPSASTAGTASPT